MSNGLKQLSIPSSKAGHSYFVIFLFASNLPKVIKSKKKNNYATTTVEPAF